MRWSLSALLLLAASSTLCSQPLSDPIPEHLKRIRVSGDGRIVAMPAQTFDRIVAISIVMRDNNRVRMNTLLEKDRTVRDLQSQVEIKTKAEERALKNEGIAWAEAGDCKTENGKLTKKNRGLRGWATAMKIELSLIVVGLGYVGYKTIVP